MNKLFSILCAAILVAALTACNNANTSAITSSDSPASTSSVESSKDDSTESSQIIEDLPNEPFYLADASIYRGTITKMTESNEMTVLELIQYEGTNFGAKTIVVNISDSTRLGTNAEILAEGDYLEVFYSIPLGKSPEDGMVVDAIGINNLGNAEFILYNGIITAIEMSADSTDSGRITMTNFNGENETAFNFNKADGTNLYLNIADLKVGDKLNIYHSMAVTASLPPQTAAIEVRIYAEPVENDETSSTDESESSNDASK